MEQQGRILGGDLETLGLQATLKMLALGNKTGVLAIESGQEWLRIAVQGGQITALEEPSAYLPDLVDILLLQGRFAAQPHPVIAQIQRLRGNHPVTVMSILYQQGLMPLDEVQRRMEFAIIQSVSRAVRWERGRFDFTLDVTPLQSRYGIPRPLDVDHVLLDALRIADERDGSAATLLARNTVPRRFFTGDISGPGLTSEEAAVLQLVNGQLALAAIAYGLMMPEAQVGAVLQRLMQLRLVELVDARLEAELQRSLVTLLTQSQRLLNQPTKTTPNQRLPILIETLGSCCNGLLMHHGAFARALRGRGEPNPGEVAGYLEHTFGPMLRQLEVHFPRTEAMIRLSSGRVDYQDVLALDHIVRGQELTEYYWDAIRVLFPFTREVFSYVLNDETGQSRSGRQFEDLWAAFLRGIEDEISRLSARYVPMRA